MTRKCFIWIGVAVLLLAGALPAAAQDYPTKPINLIIQYPPGGSTDLAARALANGAKKYLGQPLICENKSGGGGTVGVALVAAKPADGYTIGITTGSPTIAYHMGKLSFHPINDLTPIMRWGNYLFGIVVRADSQWKTIQDLFRYAKQNPEKVSYGSPGVGTPTFLAMEELSLASGIKFTHIPAKGIAENNTALLGGHIDIISDSSGWAPLVDGGKFRILATWGWIVGLLWLGRRMLNFTNRFLAHVNEMVLPFYILHQTVIVIIAYFVVQAELAIPFKYGITVVASLAVIVILYELLVSRIGVLRFLFGMRGKAAASGSRRTVARAT